MNVIVNYPTTPEGIALLEEKQAEVTLQILKNMLTPNQLDKLIKKLSDEIGYEKNSKNEKDR